MNAHQPPLDESWFVLKDVIGLGDLFALDEFREGDMDTAYAVLLEGARYTAEVLAPLNAGGDREGARLVEGRVVMPTGFREAYRGYAEGGWPGIDLPSNMDGQNLPLTLQSAFAEMVHGANASFGMLAVMLRAGGWLVLEHAEPALARKVVPRLVAGDWSATICISEPQAGSDVGRITTRAIPQPDGTYRLTGSKCWISYGDHDLTDQAVNMVLARTPGAPPGTRGISLFLVPRRRFDDGAANGCSVSRLEDKMGLHASPTCVLDFDDSMAYRVGPEHRGLGCMFTMVNYMRLEVSLQGVGIAEAATRLALEYAAERPQGGPADAPALAIIEHRDVRRMLLGMLARTRAQRALSFETAHCLDRARAANDESARAEALGLAEFLLPVCKTCGAEAAFDVASEAVQVMGGHGFVTDGGVEQLLRDSRVMAIYEGTSGIQALDLVMRKLKKDGGRRAALFTARIEATLAQTAADPDLASVRDAAVEILARFKDGTTALLADTASEPADSEAVALHYLHLAGLTGHAWMWLRMAAAARSDSEADRLRRVLAVFHGEQAIPEAASLSARIACGAAALDAADAALIRAGA